MKFIVSKKRFLRGNAFGVMVAIVGGLVFAEEPSPRRPALRQPPRRQPPRRSSPIRRARIPAVRRMSSAHRRVLPRRMT